MKRLALLFCSLAIVGGAAWPLPARAASGIKISALPATNASPDEADLIVDQPYPGHGTNDTFRSSLTNLLNARVNVGLNQFAQKVWRPYLSSAPLGNSNIFEIPVGTPGNETVSISQFSGVGNVSPLNTLLQSVASNTGITDGWTIYSIVDNDGGQPISAGFYDAVGSAAVYGDLRSGTRGGTNGYPYEGTALFGLGNSRHGVQAAVAGWSLSLSNNVGSQTNIGGWFSSGPTTGGAYVDTGATLIGVFAEVGNALTNATFSPHYQSAALLAEVRDTGLPFLVGQVHGNTLIVAGQDANGKPQVILSETGNINTTTLSQSSGIGALVSTDALNIFGGPGQTGFIIGGNVIDAVNNNGGAIDHIGYASLTGNAVLRVHHGGTNGFAELSSVNSGDAGPASGFLFLLGSAQEAQLGSNIVALGWNALALANDTDGNVAIGREALNQLQPGFSGNVAAGSFAGQMWLGSNGIFIGDGAGELMTAGATPVLIGHGSGSNLTNAPGETYLGADTGFHNTSTTGNNTLMGYQAGVEMATLQRSVIVGAQPYLSGARVDRSLTDSIWIGEKPADSTLTNYPQTVSDVILIGQGIVPTNNAEILIGSATRQDRAMFLIKSLTKTGTNFLCDSGDYTNVVGGNLGAAMTAGSSSFVDALFASQTNNVTGAMTFDHATNGVDLVERTSVRWFFNGSGSDQTLTIPSGWRTNVFSAVPSKLTNATITKMVCTINGPTGSAALQTNCFVAFEFYK